MTNPTSFSPQLTKTLETISGNVLMFLLNDWGFWKCLVVLHRPSRRTSRSHLCQPNTPTGQLRPIQAEPSPTHGREGLGIWWEIAPDVWTAETGRQKGPIAAFSLPQCQHRAQLVRWTICRPTNPPGRATGMQEISWLCICFLIKKFCM